MSGSSDDCGTRHGGRFMAQRLEDTCAHGDPPWRAIREPEWRAVLASTAALARSESEVLLLTEVCEAAVHAGGYLLAWYGRVLTNGHFRLESTACAGPEVSYLEHFNLIWGHKETTHSPGGMAVDSGQPVFTDDVLTDARFAPWREQALKHGIRSLVSIPVFVSEKLDGVLSIYSATPNDFDETATSTLRMLCQHVGVGIEKRRLASSISSALEGTIRMLSRALEARDPYTAGHQTGVAALSEQIALHLGLNDFDIQGIRIAALVHDVGKIGVPTELLLKPGELRQVEMELIKEHVKIGTEILQTLAFPWPIAEIVLQHHERLDGTGYPAGLVGDQICLAARIVAVADVAEAMGRIRPYKAAAGRAATLAFLVANRGSLFDAEVVFACEAVLQDGSFVL